MLPLLLTLLAIAPLEVTDYVQPEDCAAARVCDLSPAVDRALAYCARQALDPRVGCEIRLPAGRYDLSRPIYLTRVTRLIGAGGWGPFARTHLDTSGTGIVVGRGAAWSEIRDIGLFATGTGTVASYGLELFGRASVDGVHVDGFVQGVRAVADASNGGNADGSVLTRVVVFNSQHTGIFFDRGRVNAGVGLAVYATSNCRHAARWPQLGACSNFVDSSFLGNTWIAMHSSQARDVDTGQQYDAYRFDDPNQGSVCLGCYREDNQGLGYISQWSVAIGGHSAWRGPGLAILGRTFNGLETQAGGTVLRLGLSAGESSAFAATARGLPALSLRPETNAWRFDLARLNRLVPIRITSDAQVWLQIPAKVGAP